MSTDITARIHQLEKECAENNLALALEKARRENEQNQLAFALEILSIQTKNITMAMFFGGVSDANQK